MSRQSVDKRALDQTPLVVATFVPRVGEEQMHAIERAMGDHVAPVCVGEKALGARADPLHRRAQRLGRDHHRDVFWVRARALAETAADLVRFDPAIDHVRDFEYATAAGQWFSAAVWSDGSYGSPKGIYTSLPVRSNGDGTYEVVQGLQLSEFAHAKIKVTNDELLSERAVVADLLKG